MTAVFENRQWFRSVYRQKTMTILITLMLKFVLFAAKAGTGQKGRTILQRTCFPSSTGHHQQHHHPQHDFHKDVAEVRAVGRQPGQHCVRPGLLLREPPGEGGIPLGTFHPGSGGHLLQGLLLLLFQFAEKFAEFKEAARLAKEKSQEKTELTSTPSQGQGGAVKRNVLSVDKFGKKKESAPADLQSPLTSESVNGTADDRLAADANQHADTRAEPSQNALPFSHSSSSINKHWEAELAALKGNNAKLTAALLESTANVKQWKQQLAAYQEEAERLHKRVTELECVSGQTTVIKTQKTELNRTIEELEAALRAKEEELERLKAEVESANEFKFQKDSLLQKLEDTEARNRTLEAQLSDLEQRLEGIQLERETYRKNLRSLLELLDGKIFELTELRDTLVKLIEGS
uniref:Homer scaffold protein 1 n=1 Tax=Oryzias latipes TaxID=8090 RepID=A0A3P9KUY9_ORYLA